MTPRTAIQYLSDDTEEEWRVAGTGEADELSADAARGGIAGYVRDHPGCGYLDLACELGLPLEQVVEVCAHLREEPQLRVEAAHEHPWHLRQALR
jgi:hypothetical protein